MLNYIGTINQKLDPIFFALFFVLGSPLFTGRMLFGRGIILFLGLFFLYLNFLNQKKKYHLLVISALSVWCYAGFPLIIITIILFASYEFSQKKKFDISLLGYTVLGITVGFVIHPSFPNQFTGYYVELFLQTVEPVGIEPIAEWLPPDRNLVFGGVWFILPWIVYKLLSNQDWKAEHFIFLSLSIVYLIFSTASLRLFEMFWIFSFLFIFVTSEESKIAKYISIILLVFILFPSIYTKMKSQYKFADPTSAFDTADWMNRNLKQDEKIFLAWGDFPYFVYRSPEKKYLYGMNPLYAWSYDPKKYELQRNFFEGSIQNFQFIPSLLGYKYVVLNKHFNQPVFEFLASFNGMEMIFENKYYRIFLVKENTK
jgi:hypothetical protein